MNAAFPAAPAPSTLGGRVRNAFRAAYGLNKDPNRLDLVFVLGTRFRPVLRLLVLGSLVFFVAMKTKDAAISPATSSRMNPWRWRSVIAEP